MPEFARFMILLFTSNFMLEKVPIDVTNDLNSGTDESTSSNNEKDSLSTPLGTNILYHLKL